MQRRKVLGIGAASATMLVEDTTTPDKQLRVLKRINVSGWEPQESQMASDTLMMLHDAQEKHEQKNNNAHNDSVDSVTSTGSHQGASLLPFVGIHSVTSQNAFVNVVAEYFPLGTLTQLCNKHETPFSCETVLSLFEDMLHAVTELHAMGIVHCRISADRVFVRSNTAGVLRSALGLPSCSLRNYYLGFEASKWKSSEFPPEVATAIQSIGGGVEVGTVSAATFRQGSCAANVSWDLWSLGALLEKVLNHRRNANGGLDMGDRASIRSKLHALAISLIRTDPCERPSLNMCWSVVRELRSASPRKQVVGSFPEYRSPVSNKASPMPRASPPLHSLALSPQSDHKDQRTSPDSTPRHHQPQPHHDGIVPESIESSITATPPPQPAVVSPPAQHDTSPRHTQGQSQGIVQMPGRVSSAESSPFSFTPPTSPEQRKSLHPSSQPQQQRARSPAQTARDSRPALGLGGSPDRGLGRSPHRTSSPPRQATKTSPLRNSRSPDRSPTGGSGGPSSTTTVHSQGATVWRDKMMQQFEELEQFHQQSGVLPNTPLSGNAGANTRAAQRRAAQQRSRSLVDTREMEPADLQSGFPAGSPDSQSPLAQQIGYQAQQMQQPSRVAHDVGGKAEGRTPLRGNASARSKTTTFSTNGASPPRGNLNQQEPKPVTQNELRTMKSKHDRFKAMEENSQYRELKLEEFARRREEKEEERKVDQQQHRERQRQHRQQMKNIQQKKNADHPSTPSGSMRKELHKFGRQQQQAEPGKKVADTASGVHIFVKDPPPQRRVVVANEYPKGDDAALYPDVLVPKNYDREHKTRAAAARAASSPAKPRNHHQRLPSQDDGDGDLGGEDVSAPSERNTHSSSHAPTSHDVTPPRSSSGALHYDHSPEGTEPQQATLAPDQATLDKAEARRAALAHHMGHRSLPTSPASMERPNVQVPMPTPSLLPSQQPQPNFDEDGETTTHHHVDPQVWEVEDKIDSKHQRRSGGARVRSQSRSPVTKRSPVRQAPQPVAAPKNAAARNRRDKAQDLSVVAVMEWQIDSLVGGLHRLLDPDVVDEILALASKLAKDTTVSRTLPACNAEFSQRVTGVIQATMTTDEQEGRVLADSVLPIVFQIVALQSVEVLASELGERAKK